MINNAVINILLHLIVADSLFSIEECYCDEVDHDDGVNDMTM